MNKKIFLNILIILVLTVSISGCISGNDTDSTSFINPESGMKIFNEKGVYFQYPSNWNDLTDYLTEEDEIDKYNTITTKGISEESIFFSISDNSNLEYIKSSEVWAKAVKKKFQDSDFIIDGEGTIMINGVETHYITVYDVSESYGTSYTKIYFYADGDKTYYILYMDTKKDFATADKVVQTIKFS